ncbi:methyltransferase [Jiangella anatolica]|uniref:ArsR family transcriptional regulator n=1 Tax=Jiangella anatolica TaxID=2670374 RepID=A0A2W2B4K2_9ACTN|nr:methyltransferase [Jiangella anatolica]PZF82341.1 ArsR family transcriptional regulator [Jiangella anatolica]
MTPRALISLLYNGSKAVDVLQAALDLRILDALDPGPVTLGELSDRLGLIPGRLYKLLDCLESLGLLEPARPRPGERREYRAVAGLREAVDDVLGPASIERDRDRHPWTVLHGRLPEVLRGDFGMPDEAFSWPPADEAQIASFEQSMAAGLGPFVESFRSNAPRLWGGRERVRLLDVGGGDGTLAARLLPGTPGLTIDVYNLPAIRPLVDRTRSALDCGSRLGFVGGDFLTEPLPTGYDAMSFVRVLHDWPAETAHQLLRRGFQALAPGGRVMISEEFRTPERLARQFFWSYFLIGVDSCSSMLRELSEYAGILDLVGFSDIEILPGPVEILLATKPGTAPGLEQTQPRSE